MIEHDALNVLVRCDRCEHGIPLHGSDGCDVFRCGCKETRDRLIEEHVVAAKDDIRAQWSGSALG